MILQSDGLRDGANLEADVCILGAGPAGLTLARELDGHDLRVILIESGGLEPDGPTDSLSEGPDGQPPDPYRLRRRQFCGTANDWRIALGDGRLGVRYCELDEIDFEARDWVASSGWPFPKAEIADYYRRAGEFVGIGPFEVGHWESSEARRLAFPGDRVATRVFQFGPRDVFLRDCRRAVAESANVSAYLKLNAVGIEPDGAGRRASRVRVATLDDRRLWVRARRFVLASGGIENARLLLLSEGEKAGGFGNRHGVVGRYFIDHYGLHGGMVIPRDRSIFGRMSLYDLRSVGGSPAMGFLALAPEVLREHGLLNAAIYLVPRHPTYQVSRKARHSKRALKSALLGKPVDRRPSTTIPIGEHLRRIVRGTLAHVPRKLARRVAGRPFQETGIHHGGWSGLPEAAREFGAIEAQLLFEQAPDPENRVVLSGEKDRLGCPRARVDRRLREADLESVRRTRLILRDELARAGLGDFAIDDDFVTPEFSSVDHGASHHMGSTRMHVDPGQGVVDPDCRVHGVDNLYVAGSSVFPTGGYATPTLTIVALAIRLADHLKASLLPGSRRAAPAGPVHRQTPVT